MTASSDNGFLKVVLLLRPPMDVRPSASPMGLRSSADDKDSALPPIIAVGVQSVGRFSETNADSHHRLGQALEHSHIPITSGRRNLKMQYSN